MSGLPDYAAPVAVLLGLLALAYLGMWRGWQRRAARHDLLPLAPASTVVDQQPATLRADARYFGTTVGGSWLERVTAHGLGPRSTAGLSLSEEGLDVVRPTGSFRIPIAELRGARHDQGIAGKVIPPHGVLVVTWQHGDLLLDSGFRLEPPRTDGGEGAPPPVTELHDAWIRAVDQLVRDHEEHTA